MSNAHKSYLSHNNSYVIEAKDMYFVSNDDLDTIACFLDFKTTKDSQMKIKKFVVDFPVVVQLPQSASE